MTFSELRSSKALGEEFRQHDGVVTILMYYRRRASPKHCNNMIEVEYGGGGHRTWLRNDHEDQLVCSRVPPAPVYKGARGEAGRPLWRAPGGGVLLLVGVGLPSFLLLLGGGKEGGEGEGKGGAAPPLLVQFGPEGEGARGPPRPPLSLSPLRPMWPNTSPGGVPVTLRHSSFLRNHSEPFPCPNIVVQYINLFVSTISRLLVMSVITSGTPNSFGTSKYINS